MKYSVSAACFFFFQAEDGIRDRDVTGVQTCALPILRYSNSWSLFSAVAATQKFTAHSRSSGWMWSFQNVGSLSQIGRASCREKVEITGRAVAVKEKSGGCYMAPRHVAAQRSLC